MLGDTAVAVHPDPAGALDKAEAELRERLDKAPAKEKDGIQAQIDNIARAPHRNAAAAIEAARHGQSRPQADAAAR